MTLQSHILNWLFRLLVIAMVANGTYCFAHDNARGKPNLVFILADDLGYGDLGCFGQQRIKTPCLDQMAADGMKLTNFYAGSTVCAPSRCVLMTGYHTGHCYIRGNRRMDLRPNDLTIAEILKQSGYKTCLAGKWGIGTEGGVGAPNLQGFDYFYGYLDQRHAHNYYPTFLFRNNHRVALRNIVPKEGNAGQGKASEKMDYSHDLIINEALEFVRNNKSNPFFLYLALTIPHANNEAGRQGMEVPELGQYVDLDWPTPQKGHAAMITRMDRDCGRLFELLKQLGIDDNTLVVFTSDNGPHREGGNNPDFNDSNGVLTGIKRSLHEGGIRVPTIVRWPSVIAANSTSDHVGGFQDLMPTFAELAGSIDRCPDDIDGISFVPTLHGNKQNQRQHDALFWAFYEGGGGKAARYKNWKIIQQPINTLPRLYDLDRDISEQTDVSGENETVLKMMMQKMAENYTASNDWKFPTTPKSDQR